MGWGVEEGERYSDVLDAKLRESVYNVSIPTDLLGYARLVDYARDHGAPVKRLIVGVCMENDLLDYDALGDVPARGGEVSATRYVVTGDFERELWYDDDGILVHLRLHRDDGVDIVYILI